MDEAVREAGACACAWTRRRLSRWLLTQAEYFYAGTAQDLMKVYQSLSSKLVVEKKETEITAVFAAAGALLALLGAGLSVWWFGRVA